MIEIDGFLWFVGAVVVCGLHVLYLRDWRRERLAHLAWWKKYDADAQRRHEEFMRVMGRDHAPVLGWRLDGNGERGQA